MIVAALKVKKIVSVIKSGYAQKKGLLLAWTMFTGVHEVNDNYISMPGTHTKNRTM